MPTFEVRIGERTYLVEVPDPSATPLQVIVDGQCFNVEIAGSAVGDATLVAKSAPQVTKAATQAPFSALHRTLQAQTAPSICAEGEEISAPMPGTILSVDVRQGQPIERGQVVCVLEAMKMKNPIRAVHGGTVVEIAVQVGHNVSYGDLLMKLN